MVKLLDLFYLCQAGAEKVYAVEARRLGEAGMIWSLADLYRWYNPCMVYESIYR